jgi:hypothetical protein
VRVRIITLVALALTFAACTSGKTVPPTTQIGVTTVPSAAVDLSATPAGWVRVAYGDAQVSVPPTWDVLHAWCGGQWPPILQLGRVRQDLECTTAPPPPTVRIIPLSSIPGGPLRPVRLNGISTLLELSGRTSVYYVPSLHVVVSEVGELGARVIHTLTRSPRAVVLTPGPSSAFSSSWRSVSFTGLRFSVPASWSIERTRVTPGLGTICLSEPGVAFVSTTVTLSTDKRPLVPPGCNLVPPRPQEPKNGIQVDAGLRTEPVVTLSFSANCLDLNGLTACPATSPDYSILVLRVTVPGRSKPVFVSIGLAGNGMIARTILYSLRPA